MGMSLLYTGDIAEGRAHYDQAIALYDPAEHRPLATRFGQDVGVAILAYRSWALWLLGYPEAALADAEQALKDAREIGQAATLMYALATHRLTHILCGNYAAANAVADELVALADEKGALFWKAHGMMSKVGIGPDRQSLRRGQNDDLRDYCISINGTNIVAANVFVIFGESLCGTRPIR